MSVGWSLAGGAVSWCNNATRNKTTEKDIKPWAPLQKIAFRWYCSQNLFVNCKMVLGSPGPSPPPQKKKEKKINKCLPKKITNFSWFFNHFCWGMVVQRIFVKEVKLLRILGDPPLAETIHKVVFESFPKVIHRQRCYYSHFSKYKGTHPNNLMATWFSIWHHFGSKCTTFGHHLETILRVQMDNFETTSGQLWDYLETTLFYFRTTWWLRCDY